MKLFLSLHDFRRREFFSFRDFNWTDPFFKIKITTNNLKIYGVSWWLLCGISSICLLTWIVQLFALQSAITVLKQLFPFKTFLELRMSQGSRGFNSSFSLQCLFLWNSFLYMVKWYFLCPVIFNLPLLSLTTSYEYAILGKYFEIC